MESVRSTLDSNLDILSTIAASWENVPEERWFSLSDWFSSNKIVVLGNDGTAKEPIQRINRLFFSSLAKEILTQSGESKAKHWIFLDELRELGKLDALADLMITGRSKGASMVLGFQDVNGLYEEYGKQTALEIIGCAQNIALLRLSPTATGTADWASKVTGQLRYERDDISHTQGEKHSTTKRKSIQTESNFLPSYFTLLPRVTEEGGMKGVFFTKKLYELTTPGKFLWKEINGGEPSKSSIPIGAGDFSPFNPVSESLLLEPWNHDDLKRLRLFPEEEPANQDEPIRPENPANV